MLLTEFQYSFYRLFITEDLSRILKGPKALLKSLLQQKPILKLDISHLKEKLLKAEYTTVQSDNTITFKDITDIEDMTKK